MARFAQVLVSLAFALPSIVECAPVVDDLQQRSVHVRLALTERNVDLGYDHVMSISDPRSAQYGQHWTPQQVRDEFAPDSHSVDLVMSTLREAGITDATQTLSGSWIAFDASVQQVETLFNARCSVSSTSTGMTCTDYKVPTVLQETVDMVHLETSTPSRTAIRPRAPSTALPERSFNLPNPFSDQDLGDCARNLTPPCIRALYNVLPPHSPFLSSGSLGFFGDNSAYTQQDLDLFFASYAPEIEAGTHPEDIAVNGAQVPVEAPYASVEAELDLQTAYGLLGPATLDFYDVSAPAAAAQLSTNTGLVALLDAVDSSFCTAEDIKEGYQCGGDSLSQVLSISYGAPELLTASASFQNRICHEFMKLALLGHTVVVSSGDYGVASPPIFGDEIGVNNGCMTQDYQNEYDYYALNGTIFSPEFPATCPYVLTVGGTRLYEGQTVQDPESVLSLPKAGFALGNPHVTASSSGGFSNYQPRPSYQDAAVAGYLDLYNPGYPSYDCNGQDILSNGTNIGEGGGVYNRAGRGFPDVSANGAFYMTYINDVLTPVSGTSLSTPIWASLIAMINQERALLGKKSVGFVNPVLYQNPEVFHDITNGTNPGCGTEGFPAREGWDPVTGLGTPNFPALLALFALLP